MTRDARTPIPSTRLRMFETAVNIFQTDFAKKKIHSVSIMEFNGLSVLFIRRAKVTELAAEFEAEVVVETDGGRRVVHQHAPSHSHSVVAHAWVPSS